MIVKRLCELLNRHHIRYRRILHSPAFTAQEIAQIAHESGDILVKTIMIKVDDQIIMVVLPANNRIDLNELRMNMNANEVQLADEDEFKALFPDCVVGAMPPFGGLYNVKMVIDKSLQDNEWIVFNAGNHHELIKMRYKDYDSIIHPHKHDYVPIIV